ncbi:MAG: MmgE/PrpD family protein [Deltaproteobacteria bacterium]|nr:MmgE/PrpD family protein [Deltaproteobacteria bacterium]
MTGDTIHITERLAAFVASLAVNAIPVSVIDDARFALLDALGCGFAGAGDEGIAVLKKTIADLEENGACPALDGTTMLPRRQAALINGAMIHALEMDDTHSFSSVHAGGPVVSAALAASYRRDISGGGFLEAVIAGFDVACRLGMALRGSDPYHRGFHPTGICGIFGAATACGKIFGLDRGGYQSAWGIAGSMAGGLMSYLQNGAWTKKMHPGWAAQSGYFSAALAARGYLGPNDIFGGRFNFCDAYSDHVKIDPLTDELGERFEISRMSYKAFACCRTIHAPITAALEIMETHSIHPEDIEAVEAVIADEDLLLVLEPLHEKKQPRTTVEAQFSMPFGVALALTKGQAWPGDYNDESLKDPLTRKLAGLFSYRVNDEFTKRRPLHFPCELKIRVRGKEYTATVDAPLGDYTNPLSRERMIEKYYHLAGYCLQEGRARRIADHVLHLGGDGGPVKIQELVA